MEGQMEDDNVTRAMDPHHLDTHSAEMRDVALLADHDEIDLHEASGKFYKDEVNKNQRL